MSKAKKQSMRPIGDHVVVTLIPDETTLKLKTGGTLYLPDTAQDKPTRGVVVAVGDGRVLPNGAVWAIKVKVGETVLFSKYAGSTFKLVDPEKGSSEYLAISADDIIVVLE